MLLRKMMMIALLVTTASAVASEPLADMEGTWRGSGWARKTPEGPKETVRCQIRNTYDTASMTLTLTGQCVVPGRRLSMSGNLEGTDGSERITGSWSNPDGIGSARVVGIQRDSIVAFKFAAFDPASGRKVAQNVEWRVSGSGLRLRSTDRSNPELMMSDIAFSR